MRKLITQSGIIDIRSICNEILAAAQQREKGYIILANVPLLIMSCWRKIDRKILNQATFVLPEGKLLVWVLRCLGVKRVTPVSSSELLLACCDRCEDEQISVYFYGATPLILGKLERNLKQWYPHLRIAGSHAPPSRPLTPKEKKIDREVINDSGASIIFVGLESPKQEKWMATQVEHLNAIIIGVGKAFAVHARKPIDVNS